MEKVFSQGDEDIRMPSRKWMRMNCTMGGETPYALNEQQSESQISNGNVILIRERANQIIKGIHQYHFFKYSQVIDLNEISLRLVKKILQLPDLLTPK